MSKSTKEVIQLTVMLLLVIASAALWGFVFGTLSVSPQKSSTLSDLKGSYREITVKSDGSYKGQGVGGEPLVGCILQAPCENNLQPARGDLQ